MIREIKLPPLPKPDGHILSTTNMLKVLTIITPSFTWTSESLHANISKTGQPYVLGQLFLYYVGQPGGRGAQHEWRIYTSNPALKTKLNEAVERVKGRTLPAKTDMPLPPAVIPPETTVVDDGLMYRSPAEASIAQELSKRGILFFCNAKCRVSNRVDIPMTKEVDFIVFYKRIARILEVDGREYHQTAADDHERDRLFERHGLRSTRFTATRCLNDPKDVIDEFLELF